MATTRRGSLLPQEQQEVRWGEHTYRVRNVRLIQGPEGLLNRVCYTGCAWVQALGRVATYELRHALGDRRY